MTPRVTVDRELCIGAGRCVQLAPGAFVLDDEDVAVPAALESVSDEELQIAQRSCPSGAIDIEVDGAAG